MLPSSVNCKFCLQPAKLNSHWTHWRCQRVHQINDQRVRCAFSQSIKAKTLLENSSLDISHLCKLIAYFTMLPPPHQDFLSAQLNISSATVVSWTTYIREVEMQWCLDHTSTPFGGPGRIVEIDEAKLGHRKYNKGDVIDGQWILGGVERGTKNIFLEVVPDGTQETLCEGIQRYVLPGTSIMTDCWRSYNSLSTLGKYHHNHTLYQQYV